MKSKLKTFTVWIIMGIIFVVLLSSIMDNTNTKLTYSELITKMELGEVKEIELTADGEGAYVTLVGETFPKEVNIPNMESFMNYATELLKEGKIELNEKSQSILVTILGLLSPFGIIIIFFIFWFILMGNTGSQNGGGNRTMSFGKSKARMTAPDDKNKINIVRINNKNGIG